MEESAQREALAGFDVRPPAARGDVLAALALRPDVVVLLDGLYYSVPSVSHKELLYAVEEGVEVLGAASMGALRAAEMESLGVRGVGRIFEAFHRGWIDGDDEVAVLHGPEDLSYVPTTVALVEVRHAIGAWREPMDSSSSALLAEIKELGFVRRTPDRIEALAQRHLGGERAELLCRTLATGGLKQKDALAALAQAREKPSSQPRRVDGPTIYLSSFQTRYAGPENLPSGRDRMPRSTFFEGWMVHQILHPRASEFYRPLLRRALLAGAAEQRGLQVSREDVLVEVARLEEFQHEVYERPILARKEVEAEARLRCQEQLALDALGGEASALGALFEALGLDLDEGPEGYLGWVESSPEAHPLWHRVRAFTCTPQCLPALELAASARQLAACFEVWSRGRRVSREDLRKLASMIWGCDGEKVEAAAATRGLASSGLEPRFWEGLELLLPAERLPYPINDYVEKKRCLTANGSMP